jgi:CheY-like chemotaxis protein
VSDITPNAGRTVLIVDDNPTNLKLASEVLKMEGYAVLNAMNAEEALATVQRVTPALILMDIALPGMDGLSLTRMLKADERLKHVPIIALSSFAMKGDDRKAIAAGCEGYITKPIDTRTLGKQVAAFLTKSCAP